METVLVEYDKTKNIIYIHAHEKEFVPKYLDYVLEFHKLPKTVTRIFTKDGETNDTN